MMENARLLRTVLFALIMFVTFWICHSVLYLGWASPQGYINWFMWIEVFAPLILVCIVIGYFILSLADHLWLALVGGAVHEVYLHYFKNAYAVPYLEFLADPDPQVMWTSGLTASMLAIFIFLSFGVVIGKIDGMRER